MRGIIAQEGGRSRGEAKHVAYEVEGFERSPSVWVELKGGHIERLKDTLSEIIKREGDV